MGLDRQAAPELELAVDLEGLPAVNWREANTLGTHPLQGRHGFGDQDFNEIGIASVLGDAPHIVEELLFRVGPKVGPLAFDIRQIRHQLPEIIDTVVHDAHRSGGEPGISTRLAFSRRFEHERGSALIPGRKAAQRAALPPPTTTTSNSKTTPFMYFLVSACVQ